MSAAEFLRYDFAPLLIGVLAAVACALPGNFLLLRRQAMLGDAISHVVLPGIVAGVLLAGGMSAGPMLAGAAAAALLAAGMIEAIRRVGRVEPGAAMGVVFTALFAAGVLLLELGGAAGAHLDVEHALYGSLESLIWLEAEGWASLADPAALAGLPPQLGRMAAVAAGLAVLAAAFRRALVIASFDEGHARALGLPAGLIGLGLTAATAAAAVAAFEAVGSILTIAMLVCPPAAARLMTDRLGMQVGLSLALAAVSAAAGVMLAGHAPGWLGLGGSVSAAGMIAVVAGAILALAAVFGPRRRRLSEAPV